MKNTTKFIVIQQKTRILTESVVSQCDETCDGPLLPTFLDTLDKNNIIYVMIFQMLY